MRAWIVALVLAGCAAPSGPVSPDDTVPIHTLRDVYYVVGPEANASHDARVFVGVCGAASNVYAYTVDASGWHVQGDLRLRMVASPNATSFAIVAFLPGPGGLVEAARWTGGSDTVDAYHDYVLRRPVHIPEEIDVPVDPDGIVRLAIGCTGTGAAGYVWGEGAPSRPDYLDAVVASGAEAFVALGTEALFANGIYISPQTLNVGSIWSAIGSVRISHVSPAPQVQDAVRVQTDTIEWVGGAGWTTVQCSHRGWSDHGTWTYDADLHGDPRLHEGTMADEIATFWNTQELLFGAIAVRHTADGGADARMRFEVEHLASSSIGWTTVCQGVHFGAPLQQLFGQPGASGWERSQGILE